MDSAVLNEGLGYHRSSMGFFDKAADVVGKWLNKPADNRNPTPDDGFDEVFAESMRRARAADDAIHAGNLVAANSVITDEEASAALRYANALGFARTDTTLMGAASPQSARSHVDQLNASRARDRDPSRSM